MQVRQPDYVLGQVDGGDRLILTVARLSGRPLTFRAWQAIGALVGFYNSTPGLKLLTKISKGSK